MASILYPASPIDPALKPASPAHQTPELSSLEPPLAESSAVHPSQAIAEESHKHFSPTLPDLGGLDKLDGSEFKDNFPGSVSGGTSLPALAALASVASAPTSNLRYVLRDIETKIAAR